MNVKSSFILLEKRKHISENTKRRTKVVGSKVQSIFLEYFYTLLVIFLVTD